MHLACNVLGGSGGQAQCQLLQPLWLPNGWSAPCEHTMGAGIGAGWGMGRTGAGQQPGAVGPAEQGWTAEYWPPRTLLAAAAVA